MRRLLPFVFAVLLAVPALAQEEPPADEAPAPEEEAPEGDAPPPAPEGALAPPEEPPPPPPAVDLNRGTATLYAEAYELFGAGDLAGALPLFEEVVRREPDHPSARNYLVECLMEVGRADDAEAARDGAVPPGPVTAYVPPATKSGNNAAPPAPVVEAPETPESKKARGDKRNPRRTSRGGAGLTLLGPGVGLGLYAEFRPHWAVALDGGLGFVLIKSDSGTRSGMAGVWAEASLMPVPFRLTPTIGVGITTLAGGAAWRLDSFAQALAGRNRLRLVGYWHLGLRYDSARGFHVAAGVGFVPTGREPGKAFAPWPGFKFGMRF